MKVWEYLKYDSNDLSVKSIVKKTDIIYVNIKLKWCLYSPAQTER